MSETPFTIVWAAAAARQFRKLDKRAQEQIRLTLLILTTNPRPPRAIKLVGGEGEWRVRTGDYRIVYEINDGELRVLVVRVGHRRDIYQ
jgi:mRNA interferase RelE/StbE